MKVSESAPTRVRLAVPPPTRGLHGTLRAADGSALAQRELQLTFRGRTRARGFRLTSTTDESGAFDFELPDFAGLENRLLLPCGGIDLEHGAPVAGLTWTVPDLVPVELHLAEALAGERWGFTWSGPSAAVTGQVRGTLGFVDGRCTSWMPVGALELSGVSSTGRTLQTHVLVGTDEGQVIELPAP